MLAALKFLADLPLYEEVKPFTLYGYPDHVQPQSNCEYEIHKKIVVKDARGHEKDYSLEGCGFQFHRWPSQCDLRSTTFESSASRYEVWKYLKETISIAESILDAQKVLCFDWRLRKSNADCDVKGQLEDLEHARYRALSPASLMHCDYSYEGGMETLKIHLSSEEYQDVVAGRCEARIINIWRPLQAVRHTPLILCDRRTVQAVDILDVDQVAPTKVEQSMTLKYNASQEYHWLSSQQPEEIVIFASWKSAQDEDFSSHTPHGANIEAPPTDNDIVRESVEVRLIVMSQSP